MHFDCNCRRFACASGQRASAAERHPGHLVVHSTAWLIRTNSNDLPLAAEHQQQVTYLQQQQRCRQQAHTSMHVHRHNTPGEASSVCACSTASATSLQLHSFSVAGLSTAGHYSEVLPIIQWSTHLCGSSASASLLRLYNYSVSGPDIEGHYKPARSKHPLHVLAAVLSPPRSGCTPSLARQTRGSLQSVTPAPLQGA
eukprot:228955-Pelagomonas_calceolata.AAC.3